MKQTLLFLLFFCTTASALVAQRDSMRFSRHFIWTNVLQSTQPGYRPWNIQYELAVSREISLQWGVGFFNNRHTPANWAPHATYDSLVLPEYSFVPGLDYLNWALGGPKNGTIKASCNQRGFYTEMSLKRYFKPRHAPFRFLFAPGVRYYRYTYDQLFLHRSIAEVDIRNYRRNTNYLLSKNFKTEVMYFHFATGGQVNLKRHWHLEAIMQYTCSRENRKAQKAKRPFDLPEWAMNAYEVPYGPNLTMQLKAGYSF